MASKSDPEPSVNSWLEEELYQQYLHNRGAVDESWKEVFEHGQAEAAPAPAAPAAVPASAAPANAAPAPAPAGELVPLKGAAARIAQNMAASTTVPLATSQRTI